MTIRELYKRPGPVVSFEVFPPKKDDDVAKIYTALEQLHDLSPDYISVTYGAGGDGGKDKTAEIASVIRNRHNIPALAHLTCITSDKQRVRDTLEHLQRENVQNVLALRGDAPVDGSLPLSGDYRYSQDLIQDIRSQAPDMCIGAACYPEAHIDCDYMTDSLVHLRLKQEAGADFLVTQLFFDNDMFYRFLEQARANGIKLPISAGVMPILGRKQIERMIFMCGASLPAKIIRLLHKYEHSPEDLRAAGIQHAADQALDLIKNGVDGVHIYTMNQPDIARICMERLGRV